MNAGDLTPNMIGKQRIRIRYEEADIEGLLTGLDVDTDLTRTLGHNGEIGRIFYYVTLGISVGNIDMREVRLDHPVQLIQ